MVLKDDQGIQGVKGNAGVDGVKGDQGIQGVKGNAGVDGVKGDQVRWCKRRSKYKE